MAVITPNWSIPNQVQARYTTRQGGNSHAPWDDFNLALHVGDEPQRVAKNRSQLRSQLPSEPVWLEQIHSSRVINLARESSSSPITADGSLTNQSQQICTVMTADCLPLLVTNQQGDTVMALHAGWRGLAGGIIEQGISDFLQMSHCLPEEILVWLGPAIGPDAFEVGNEVREIFLADLACQQAFMPSPRGEQKWMADIYQLARLKLQTLNIQNISGGTECTYANQSDFFSYRRNGTTGRMVSMIWIEN